MNLIRYSYSHGLEEESEEEMEDLGYNFWDEIVNFQDFQVENPNLQMFRVIASYPPDNEYSGVNHQPMPEGNDTLYARYPGEPETWGSVLDHLSWTRQPTPFISFFNNFETAIRWKDQFIRKGAYRVLIFCYNTKHVRDLLDAHELAKEIEREQPMRLGNRHQYEYLVCDRIHGRHCAGVYTFTE
ncbi:hypothetical protein LTR41_008080 [Exophiala xenobiotica]|nr:hypothetical protein LTR41_008080 [Exophiala xenobiotica]